MKLFNFIFFFLPILHDCMYYIKINNVIACDRIDTCANIIS